MQEDEASVALLQAPVQPVKLWQLSVLGVNVAHVRQEDEVVRIQAQLQLSHGNSAQEQQCHQVAKQGSHFNCFKFLGRLHSY